MALQRVPYIRYQMKFQANIEVKALINSDSEVNAMTEAYATKLGLSTRRICDKVWKIDNSPLEMYRIASAKFLI